MFPPSLGHGIDGSLQVSVARESVGKPCKSSSLQKDNFFSALISTALDSVHFSFDQSACKCHPRLIGMAAFKREFHLEGDFFITSGCSCYLLNMSLLQSVREATVKSTPAQKGCNFLKLRMDSVKHFAP